MDITTCLIFALFMFTVSPGFVFEKSSIVGGDCPNGPNGVSASPDCGYNNPINPSCGGMTYTTCTVGENGDVACGEGADYGTPCDIQDPNNLVDCDSGEQDQTVGSCDPVTHDPS